MSQMTYLKFVYTRWAQYPFTPLGIIAPFVGAYIGLMFDRAETQRMIRYRDRSAMFGRPPPPPGVEEIPSW